MNGAYKKVSRNGNVVVCLLVATLSTCCMDKDECYVGSVLVPRDGCIVDIPLSEKGTVTFMTDGMMLRDVVNVVPVPVPLRAKVSLWNKKVVASMTNEPTTKAFMSVLKQNGLVLYREMNGDYRVVTQNEARRSDVQPVSLAPGGVDLETGK